MLEFYGDAQHVQDLSLAKEIGETLHAAYPGHLWACYVGGGVVKISNLRLSTRFGMVLHQDKLGDATVRKAKIIRSAGEFLERAHWARGAYSGEDATVLEGAHRWHAVQGRGAI